MKKDTFMSYLENKACSLCNYWSTYESEVEDRIDLLIQYYQQDLKEENAELKAKVYTYEKIIANSNFAPILKENKKKENRI